MRMTLSTPAASNDRPVNPAPENKSPSPTGSPRSSPRPSPRSQTRREHSRSDTHLSVNFREKDLANKIDSSSLSPELGLTRISLETAPDCNRSESTGGSSSRERKDVSRKKKSAWYTVLYPTYKSRSEDFKKIFKDVPDDERLVVDYSCALQKEILVHGRLYVSQNYLCFYANIFGWETNVTIKWKDVSAITKEKTALVIPNAVLVSTRSEKFFLTSFVARDKTYLMLFRVWQNALMDQPMTQQEMWQWVHQCYGDELGLTSDDEDYVAPGTEEDKLSASLGSFSEECGSHCDIALFEMASHETAKVEEDSSPNGQINEPKAVSADLHLPTDMSDTTESDAEKNNKSQKTCYSPVCTELHEGKLLMNEVIPLHIDQLFTLLFTSSKFFLDFHATRKTTDLAQTSWRHNADGTKSRVVNLTVQLNQTMGPKTAQVTETQVMIPCSTPGCLYSVNVETVNAGVPYADSFSIYIHYCLHKVSENQSSIAVYGQIKYKKSVWGLVKGMIEKNCWQGLEEFFISLHKSLCTEAEETAGPAIKRKSRRKRRQQSIVRTGIIEDIRPNRGSIIRSKATTGGSILRSDFSTLIVFSVLILLVVLNVLLYYKLWSLEETPPYKLIDLNVLKNPPKTHEDWLKLFQQQETLHTIEVHKWQRILKTAIQLLRQTEESLMELQKSLQPTYTNKVLSIIQNSKDTLEDVKEEL